MVPRREQARRKSPKDTRKLCRLTLTENQVKNEQRNNETSCQLPLYSSIISKSWLTTNTSRFEMKNKAIEYTQLSGRKLATNRLENGKISTLELHDTGAK